MQEHAVSNKLYVYPNSYVAHKLRYDFRKIWKMLALKQKGQPKQILKGAVHTKGDTSFKRGDRKVKVNEMN